MDPISTAAVAGGIIIVLLLLTILFAVFSLHSKVDDLASDAKNGNTINEALIRSNGEALETVATEITLQTSKMHKSLERIEAQTKHIPVRDPGGKFRKQQ